ncbi:MAG TPA: hypothetical protein VGV90_02595 [Solirubrobacteraceae bacterium]|nr:hypothetical protein [Solirubrobacteraceae bacterium]
MLVITHAGHWALVALQAAPLIVVAAVVMWRTWAQRGPRAQTGKPAPHA